jgi:6-phosphofructokinase 1
MVKIGVLTGGGDCPGLNAAIRSIVLHAKDYNWDVLGIKSGWRGLYRKEYTPLNISDVEEIISKGGTIVGTSRFNPLKEEYREKVLNNLDELDLEGLIAIGGEDTLGVAAKLHQERDIRVVGVPKTMDNDLSCTDYTFGFDTAVTVAIDALERLIDTGKSHGRVMVLEVMGRSAGWVALFTGLAGGADFILIPEKESNLEELGENIKRVYQRKGYATIVVSEGVDLGIKREEERDEFGHVLLKKLGVGDTLAEEIGRITNLEVRSVAIGHVQRGGAPTLFDRMLATRLGIKAVDLIKEGKFGYMAALVNNKIDAVPLYEATKEIKRVTEEWFYLMETLCK